MKQAMAEQGQTRSLSSKICLITSFDRARPRSNSQLSLKKHLEIMDYIKLQRFVPESKTSFQGQKDVFSI